MPIPVAVGAVALAARVGAMMASRWSFLSIGAMIGAAPDLWESVKGWIVSEVLRLTGLELDADDPLSDASFANAITARTGVPLRSVKDRALIEEDVDDYLASRVSEKIGYTISTFRNVTRLRADFELAALAVLTEKTGIPFVPPAEGETLTADAIRDQVKDWARAQIMTELQGRAGDALQALQDQNLNFEAMAADINGKLSALGSSQTITPAKLAMRVAESLVKESVGRFEATARDTTKADRRALQLRAAQRKFRAAHGNRVKYVPLGMNAVIE